MPGTDGQTKKNMYVFISDKKTDFSGLKCIETLSSHSQEVKSNTINPPGFQHCLLHYL